MIRKRRGFTLVEMMLVVGITAIIIPVAVEALSQTLAYFRQTQMREQLIADSNSCLHTMHEMLRVGKASTVVITSPPGSPPYSSIQFRRAFDNTLYQIYWANNTVQMKIDPHVPVSLASNVASLMFVHPDTSDNTTIAVTLRLAAAVDSRHTAASSTTDHLIRMEQN